MPAKKRPYTILVVDDDEAYCRATAEMLRHNGFPVCQARSAGEALALLESIIPDLMLVDIMMPGIDGLSLMRTLAPNPGFLHTPLVVVSAKAQPKDRWDAWIAGAEGYITKPFTNSELLELINHIFSKSAQAMMG